MKPLCRGVYTRRTSLCEPYPSHNSAGVMQECDPSTRQSQLLRPNPSGRSLMLIKGSMGGNTRQQCQRLRPEDSRKEQQRPQCLCDWTSIDMLEGKRQSDQG